MLYAEIPHSLCLWEILDRITSLYYFKSKEGPFLHAA